MSDDERPRLDQINLVVGDMPAMRAFYETLGLSIPTQPPPWNSHHVSAESGDGFDLDLDSSEFASQWNQGWPAGGTGIVLGFKVATREAVDAVYDKLIAAGHTGQQPPWDAFWGARFAIVADPDGNSVGIMSPRDPERTAPPPDLEG